ncbi:MAG: hypothetical protein LQ351_003228 [Letrouitia transgressa]|nr:MAG: hypothetical protein LQ351_003228 [Letrouitia transgressa]
MGTREPRRHRKERGARSEAEKVQAEDIPLARPTQNTPRGKTLIEIAKERQLLQNPDTALPITDNAGDAAKVNVYLDVLLYSLSLTLLHFTLTFLVHHHMPLNLFCKPSKPTSPPSLTTISLVATHLLRLGYPHIFSELLPVDTAQFLTEFYGSDPSSTRTHWDWIGCTFPPEAVEHALNTLDKAHSPHSLRSSHRRKLSGLTRKIWKEQERLQEKIDREQEAAVAAAYRRKAEERKRDEIGRIARIAGVRVRVRAERKAYGAAAVVGF